MKLEEDITEFFVHLRKPATVYGELEGRNAKVPSVSPFDLSYDETRGSAAQILNYWNVVQVIYIRGERNSLDIPDMFEFLDKMRDDGLIAKYRYYCAKDKDYEYNFQEK